jgi:multidrug resistance efflux pump
MSQITAQRSTAEYSIEQAESLIKSYNEEMQKIGLEYTEKANQNVSRLQRELNALEDVESRLANRLQRSVIRAPSDGIVFRVYKTTEGAVLGPGESFAEIFPDQDELNVEVLVQPRYISSVEPGQNVNLVFQSDHRANLVPLEGIVEYISTDTIVDETTGVASYVVHVSIRKGQEDRRVLPGNIAEAFFSTEPKTLVELVTEPLTRFAFRSFKG